MSRRELLRGALLFLMTAIVIVVVLYIIILSASPPQPRLICRDRYGIATCWVYIDPYFYCAFYFLFSLLTGNGDCLKNMLRTEYVLFCFPSRASARHSGDDHHHHTQYSKMFVGPCEHGARPR
jgi:hypothetical protein